ncbi:unnamed protein product, partial [Mesorhabditis belari]|uniref:Uncharacterized protein n=1 Tax=Mesorhabditis belari TaxID=2138241 RepID=A0AAF3EH68_9BILA
MNWLGGIFSFLLVLIGVNCAELDSFPINDPLNEPCERGKFRCAEGECIPSRLRCDGKKDCFLGDDEDCPKGISSCKASEVACGNGICIPKTRVCDGKIDCVDWTDEVGCGSTPRLFKTTTPTTSTTTPSTTAPPRGTLKQFSQSAPNVKGFEVKPACKSNFFPIKIDRPNLLLFLIGQLLIILIIFWLVKVICIRKRFSKTTDGLTAKLYPTLETEDGEANKAVA